MDVLGDKSPSATCRTPSGQQQQRTRQLYRQQRSQQHGAKYRQGTKSRVSVPMNMRCMPVRANARSWYSRWPPAPIRRSAAVPAAGATVTKPAHAVQCAERTRGRRQQYADPDAGQRAVGTGTSASWSAASSALEHKPPPVAAATGRAPQESAQRMRTKLERLRSQSAGLAP